jgi:hypothetical protein
VLELKTNRKHADFFALFSHIVTGCHPEVVRGKPEPDIFNVCRAKFSGLPEFEIRFLQIFQQNLSLSDPFKIKIVVEK